jgi:hypothetical protein
VKWEQGGRFFRFWHDAFVAPVEMTYDSSTVEILALPGQLTDGAAIEIRRDDKPVYVGRWILDASQGDRKTKQANEPSGTLDRNGRWIGGWLAAAMQDDFSREVCGKLASAYSGFA